MGPIELVFIVMVGLFGVVGIVRGHTRELGVTIMILLALWVLGFIDKEMPEPLGRLLNLLVGPNEATQRVTKGILFGVFLTGVVFISYQGETLSFHGKGKNNVFGACSGLLNGYLFAGSLWYYLAEAGWPLRVFEISVNYTQFYRMAWDLLPPNVLTWPYLIGLAAFMLIMRIVK